MTSILTPYLHAKTLTKLLALVIVQQLLGALGTYALVAAGFAISNFQLFLAWVAVSLFTHMLAPFFGLLIRPLESRLTYQAYGRFLDEKLLSKAGRPSLWPQKEKKESFLASIGSETDSYLGAILFVGLDVFSYILSVVLGVLVLGLALDPLFIPAFLMAGVLSGAAYKFLQRKVTAAAHQEQEARTDLAGYLLMSWENIFFKNQSVLQKYHHRYSQKFAQAQTQSIRATTWSEGLVFVLCVVSSLPVMAVVLWLIFNHQGQPGLLVAMLATLPRQLNLLNTFRSIFQSLASFISFEAKFQTLSRNADLEERSLESRIQVPLIRLQGKTFSSLEELHNEIAHAPAGRFEIRGVNGSGKSTLLLSLNDTLPASFYLPAHPQFDLEKAEGESTGQRLIRHIEDICALPEKYILLDEWDANLDEANIQKVNALLNEMAKSKVILEIRHRESV